MRELPLTCVIGAGSSGIAAAKALHERGIPFDCYEKSDQVGGNWVFGNRNGMSSAYRSLHINTSRERMEYSDFPMPKSYPDFPHHTHIAQYFNDYVDLIVGPVFYLDSKLQPGGAAHLWTTQIDVDIPLGKAPKKP